MLALKIKLSTLLNQLNEVNVLRILNLMYNPFVETDSKAEFNNVTCDVNYLLNAVVFKPASGATINVASETYLERITVEQAQIRVLVRSFHDPDLWDNLLDYNLYLVSQRENTTKFFGFVETNATAEEEVEMLNFIESLNLQPNTCDTVVIY